MRKLPAVLLCVVLALLLIRRTRKEERIRREMNEHLLSHPARYARCLQGHWHKTRMSHCKTDGTRLLDANERQLHRIHSLFNNDEVHRLFRDPYLRCAFVRYVMSYEEEVNHCIDVKYAFALFKTAGIILLTNEISAKSANEDMS